jgi:hypothetical protein
MKPTLGVSRIEHCNAYVNRESDYTRGITAKAVRATRSPGVLTNGFASLGKFNNRAESPRAIQGNNRRTAPKGN